MKSAISQEVNQKNIIYLDTKYWVDICDVTRGKSNNEEIKNIYNLIKKKVANNKMICPISQVTMKEVLKQYDEESLRHTAKIIDELSKGIIICDTHDRFSLELYNFFYDNLGIETDVVLRENFWCMGIAHIYGIKIPYLSNLNDETNYMIQKEFLKDISSYGLLDFIDKLGLEKLKIYRDSKIDTEWYDKNKQDNIDKHRTFHELYMAEIGGSIDVYKKDIEEVFRLVINTKAKQDEITLENEDNNTDPRLILNMIYNVFNHRKAGLYLPSLDIGAILHAKLRWNKTQKYKQGDIDDIRHATTALPYYDYFFTERSLHNMIKECKYDEKYNCEIASNNKDVLKILESIS